MSIEALEMICAKCRGNEWGPETPRKEILAWFHDFAAAAIEQAERQEPYAWEFAGTIFHDKDEVFGWWNSDKDVSDTPPLALYTAPPQQEKQEPTPAMIQALIEQYDSDRAIGIGFNPQTLCRAVMAVQRQPLTEAQRQQRDGINSPNRGSLGFQDDRAHGIGGGE
jgi:hypothetical protein